MKIRWDRDVLDHDYDAAEAFLSLRLDEARAYDLVRELQSTEVTTRRANDILRACDREPLPTSDPGVARTLRHIAKHRTISPVLVVSFDYGGEIADGYHRVSAAYALDPFADVPLRIASLREDPR